MVKAVLTENSVQWFVDSKDYKDPFLEYDFKADELKIYDEEAYYKANIGISMLFLSHNIKEFIPDNCPDYVKRSIIEKIYNKRTTYNLMNYVTLPTRICKCRTVKTILDENSIKWFSAGCKTPFLEFDIKLCKLEIYDKDIFIFERFDTLQSWKDIFALPLGLREDSEFKKAWYPENCPAPLKMIISYIIHHGYLTKEDIEFYKKFSELDLSFRKGDILCQ